MFVAGIQRDSGRFSNRVESHNRRRGVAGLRDFFGRHRDHRGQRSRGGLLGRRNYFWRYAVARLSARNKCEQWIPADMHKLRRDDCVRRCNSHEGRGGHRPSGMRRVQPAVANFGALPTGTASPPVNILLTNGGDANLDVTGVTITGANSADFSQMNTCLSNSPIAPGGNCGFAVTFTPAIVGTETASLQMADDGVGAPQTLTLYRHGSLGRSHVIADVTEFWQCGAGRDDGAKHLDFDQHGKCNAKHHQCKNFRRQRDRFCLWRKQHLYRRRGSFARRELHNRSGLRPQRTKSATKSCGTSGDIFCGNQQSVDRHGGHCAIRNRSDRRNTCRRPVKHFT